MKKTISLAIALILALGLAACGAQTLPSGGGTNTPPPFSDSGISSDAPAAPTDDSSVVIGDGSGTYEGETDTNGLFSGYGVWIYHNFRYEGYFENGIPNGEGTLFIILENGDVDTSLTGQWVNGFGHGTFTEVAYNHPGPPERYSASNLDVVTWIYELENGYPVSDETVPRVEEENPYRVLEKGILMAGVPPWAFTLSGEAIASIPDIPDTTQNTSGSGGDNPPSSTIPNNGIPTLSDWVGKYASSSTTLTIVSASNEKTLVLTISKAGGMIHEEALNVGYLLEPGQMAASGHHDNPLKSITEFTTLQLSEDYDIITLLWSGIDDNLVGDYHRQ